MPNQKLECSVHIARQGETAVKLFGKLAFVVVVAAAAVPNKAAVAAVAVKLAEKLQGGVVAALRGALHWWLLVSSWCPNGCAQ